MEDITISVKSSLGEIKLTLSEEDGIYKIADKFAVILFWLGYSDESIYKVLRTDEDDDFE